MKMEILCLLNRLKMLKFSVKYFLGDSCGKILACCQGLYKKVGYVYFVYRHYLYHIRNDYDIQ